MHWPSLPRQSVVKYGLGSMIAGTFTSGPASLGRMMSAVTKSILPLPSWSTPGCGMKTRSRTACV